MFYNYIYLDPRKPGKYIYPNLNFSLLYEPFYVGKGHKPKGSTNRKYVHLNLYSLKQKSLKNNKIKSLLQIYSKEELKMYILQINNNIPEPESIEIEKVLIKSIGRIDIKTGSLCNHTDGGEGISNPSVEKRQSISDRFKGVPNINKGKTYEEIYGKEEAERLKKTFGSPKESHPLWNKGHSEESKRKISQNHADFSGAKNGRARLWKVIDPNGKTYTLHGTFKNFCKENNLNENLLRKSNGIPVKSKKGKSNTDGWSAILLI